MPQERFLKFKERMMNLVFTNEASEFIEVRLGVKAILDQLSDHQTYGKLLVSNCLDSHTLSCWYLT